VKLLIFLLFVADIVNPKIEEIACLAELASKKHCIFCKKSMSERIIYKAISCTAIHYGKDDCNIGKVKYFFCKDCGIKDREINTMGMPDIFYQGIVIDDLRR